MGVRINPCHGCPAKTDCDLYEQFRAVACGIGARSVSFRCERIKAELRPGRRVVVPTPRMRVRQVYSGSFYCLIEMVAAPATVTASDDAGWFSCVIDPGNVYGRPEEVTGEPSPPSDKYRFRKKMRAARIIRFLDEPDAEICARGNVKQNGKCNTSSGECQCEAMAAFDEWVT